MNSGKLKGKEYFSFRILEYLIILSLSFQLINISSINYSAILNQPSDNYTLADDVDYNSLTRSPASWAAYRLWTDNEDLDAISVGDVDDSHIGDEIVVGGKGNKVKVVYGLGQTWAVETIYNTQWWVMGIAIGDVYPHHQGNEIIVIDRDDNIIMLYKSSESGKWVSKTIFQETNWLYDLAIGDIDPNHPGDEIIYVGEPRSVSMINYSKETDDWSRTRIWDKTPASIEVVAVGDFDNLHPGNEVAVTGVYINEIMLREISYNYSTGNWDVEIMGAIEKEPIEMVIGDFYSGHSGDELAVVSILKNVLMVYQDDSTHDWVQTKLWQDTESIRDVEVCDIIPEHPGNELVLVGYSDNVNIVMENSKLPSGWETSTIYYGTSNLICITAGDFDAFHPDIELAILQSAGKLLKLQYETPGFNLYCPQQQFVAAAGFAVDVPIIITKSGEFKDEVNLSLINSQTLSDSGISVDLHPRQLVPPARAELRLLVSDLTIPMDYNISIMGETAFPGIGDIYCNFTLTVLEASSQAFNLTIAPSLGSIVADFSVEFQIKNNIINNWDEAILLNIKYLPPGVSYSVNESKLLPNQTTKLTLTTTSSTPASRYFIIITGTPEKNRSLNIICVLVLDVLEPTPNYDLTLSSENVSALINGNVALTISGYSYFGFNEPIDLIISGLPETISMKLEPESFIPTGNTTLTLSPKPGTDLERYNVTITGTSSSTGIIKTVSFYFSILPEAPGFDLSLNPPNYLKIKEGENAVLVLEIIPDVGFDDEINITISGLTNGMTWNRGLFPIKIDSKKSITIEITNIAQPGKYDLTFIAKSTNQTIESELDLDVTPEEESNGAVSDNNIYLTIVLIIVGLIIFIILLNSIKRPSEIKPEKTARTNIKKRTRTKKKSRVMKKTKD